jgi:hypothetical protein
MPLFHDRRGTKVGFLDWGANPPPDGGVGPLGAVLTLVGALSSPAAMAARMRPQNASSMSK